jgi:hypothetical protein
MLRSVMIVNELVYPSNIFLVWSKDIDIKIFVSVHSIGLYAVPLRINYKFYFLIAGVNEFVDNHDTPKHLIIGIGNTDISSRPLSECMADMTVLLQKLTSLQNYTVYLLSGFERIGKETLNQNVSKMNIVIKKFCEHH